MSQGFSMKYHGFSRVLSNERTNKALFALTCRRYSCYHYCIGTTTQWVLKNKKAVWEKFDILFEMNIEIWSTIWIWKMMAHITCKILVILESRYGIWPSRFFGSDSALITFATALTLKKTTKQNNKLFFKSYMGKNPTSDLSISHFVTLQAQKGLC